MITYNGEEIHEDDCVFSELMNQLIPGIFAELDDNDQKATVEWFRSNGYVVSDHMDCWVSSDSPRCHNDMYATREWFNDNDYVWSSLMDRFIPSDESRYDDDDNLATSDWFCDNDYIWADHMDCYIHCDDAEVDINDNYATTRWYDRNDYVRLNDDYGRTENRGRWCSRDYAYNCEDINDYLHQDDCYIDDDGYAYADESNMPGNNSEHVRSYHSSSNNIVDLSRGSKFKIGFEVEKLNFDGADSVGDYVGEFDMFAGFETDSSCGVEAVTNILPLGGPDSEEEKYVFAMIDDAKSVIDSDYDKSCGGHISISCTDYQDQYDLLDKVRTNMALWYGMFRYRLKNNYCNKNKPLKKNGNDKYAPINVKSRCIEIRLPNAVRNTENLKNRYRLTYNLMQYSIVNPLNFEDFLEINRPLLVKIYSGQENKVETIFEYARAFRRYLLDESVSEFIEEFVND